MALKVEPPQIDGYRYDRHLGSGGYSEVFVYEHLQLGREVAVKVLTQGASEDEARVMAQLASHTHIVDVYSVGVTSTGLAYLVMQLYSGPTFAQRLRSGPLRIPEVLQLGVQLSGALEWAHRLGVLHRDIKPANILTSGTGRPGLADFGISTSGGSRSEQTGVSLPWVPPEVLEGHAPDEPGDVYSLAATLYTLLEGHPPFVEPGGDNSDQAVVRRTLAQPPPSLTRPDAPHLLTALLRSALSKSPDARPSSAEAFGRALQGVEAELRLAQTPLEVASTMTAPVDRTDDDATRVRGVRVIDPQPVDDRTRSRPDESTRARVDEATRARPASPFGDAMIAVPPHPQAGPLDGRRRTVSAPDIPVAAPVDGGPELPVTAARRRTPVMIGAAALVLAVAVAAIVVIGGSGTDRQRSGSDDGPYSSEATIVGYVPPVADLHLERVDAGTVRAVWTAPTGVTEFAWRRCDEGVEPSVTVTSDTAVVVAGVPDGATACVAVIAQDEGGATSEERTAVGPTTTTTPGAP